jgi:uncharacterized protein (TIGR00369 family)
MNRAPPEVTGPQFERMVRGLMPLDDAFSFVVEEMARGYARLRLRFHERQLRPGGTIAGPVMFALADTALWAAVLSVVGELPLAVTSDMHIRFLRRPEAQDLVAECELIKQTGRLMVGTVTIRSVVGMHGGSKPSAEATSEPVALVTGTYAVPRSRPSS